MNCATGAVWTDPGSTESCSTDVALPQLVTSGLSASLKGLGLRVVFPPFCLGKGYGVVGSAPTHVGRLRISG